MKTNTLFIMILFLLFIITVIPGCSKNEKTLFEQYGNGLDSLSREGETTTWDISVTKGSDTVTILESFYNEDSIWIGCKLEGNRLFDTKIWYKFYYNEERISDGSNGGLMDDTTEKPMIRYAIMQPSQSFDVSELPDEFILDFVVEEAEGLKRQFEFEIPLKRSARQVIKP